MKSLYFILILVILPFKAGSQIFKDPSQPVEKRVEDLLGRMTPEEKFWQLFMIPGDLSIGKDKLIHGIFGFQISSEGRTGDASQQLLNYAPGASAAKTAEKINEIQRFFVEESRLGIPIIPFDEALHGLIRKGATAFPQSIGLAASFDTALMHRVSGAIALECKTRGIRQILSPVINIASDVRWGRVEETYGEDPYLSSVMGVAYVSEFEKRGIITTPKHLLANVGDGGRDSYPIHLNERYLREIHLPPFDACFNEGGTLSVMTSYNSLDGEPCSSNDWILNKWLKEENHFKGFVISDANAVGGANVLHMTAKNYAESGVDALTGGLDVIFQTSYDHHTLFIEPFLNGEIPQNVIDEAVKRVLRAKFKLGLFENPYVDPAGAEKENGSPEHRALAEEAARKSIVLLKNQNNTLPISEEIKRIALIGPDAAEARLGGYSGPGIDKISIYDGLVSKAQGSGLRAKESGKFEVKREILLVEGCSREDLRFQTVSGEYLFHVEDGVEKQGLKGEYFNNVDLSGEPALTRNDRQLSFQWTLFGPDMEKLNNDFFSARWTGILRSPGDGKWNLGIEGNDGYRIWIDGVLFIDKWIKSTRDTVTRPFNFEGGRVYDIRIEYHEPVGRTWLRLVWDYGIENDNEEKIREAVELAASSDMAIVVVGIEEGEFRDRALLSLPGRQEEMIKRIAASGKPTIVVLVGGSAITMENWIDDADAILDVWYPGEAGGNAVADVLYGHYNPGGRLPVTFPVSEAQLPLVYNHKPTGRGDDYINLTGEPLFPFGFGLSYTTFEYSGMKLDKRIIGDDEPAMLSLIVKNTGEFDGDEVVQLYIHDMYASIARPVMELKGIRRIHLKAGESRKISFEIAPGMLSMLNRNMEKVVEPGDFMLMAGSSSTDIRQRIRLTLD
jgi:beta-glucosidase